MISGDTGISGEYVPGEVLVKFKKKKKNRRFFRAAETFESKAKRIAKRKKAKTKNIIKGQEMVVFEKKGANVEQMISDIEKDAEIEWVVPNYIITASAQTKYWNIGNGTNSGVNADLVHSDTTGNGVVVAVVDTGVDWDHPDLVANHWTNAGETNCSNGVDDDGNGFIDDCNGWDFIGTTINSPAPDNDPIGYNGHATHVAGTIAAADNDIGVLGVAPQAKIMDVKVLDDSTSGRGTLASVVGGIEYAVNNGADIINLSLGVTTDIPALKEAVDNAHNAGVVVVSAAGNSSGTTLQYPGGYTSTIGVGSIGQNNTHSAFSNTGPKLDVVAPGESIISTYPEHLTGAGEIPYATSSGTSMSTPHVSGMAALYLEKHPSASPNQVRDAIRNGAVDLGITGRDNTFGYGRIDAPRTIYGDAQFGDIVINELAWSGSNSSSTDEWIELRNTTNHPINITGYELTKNTGTETLMLKIPSNIIPARGLFLISNNAASNSVLGTNPDLVDTAVSLSNTKLQIKLYNGNFSVADVVDIAGDGSAPLAGTSSSPRKTMSRSSTPDDGLLAENWFTSTLTGTGYDSGATEKGTPGEINETDPTTGGDTTAPVRDNGSPTSELTSGTTEAIVSLITDEPATCKYSATAGTSYASMTDTFGTTGGTFHSDTFTGLINGGSYEFYVRCTDTAGNTNTDDYLITFSVASPVDSTPPVRSNGAPSGEQASGTTSVTLSVDTDEAATCTYDGTAFDATGGTSHSALYSPVTDGSSYSVNVICTDTAGNTNTDDYLIQFSIAENTPPPSGNGTLYEDGNSADDWAVYDSYPSTPVTPTVTSQNGQIVTNGNGIGNLYGMYFPSPNTSQFTATWDWGNLSTSERERIYWRVETTQGIKYLRYRPVEKTCASSSSGRYIYCGIGSDKGDGNLHTITRDLQADMHTAEPSIDIISVSAVFIRGSSVIDNIRLNGDSEQITLHSISGNVSSDGVGLGNVVVEFSHATLSSPASVTTNSNGDYSQVGFREGETYTVEISSIGITFDNNSVSTLVNEDKTVNFTGTSNSSDETLYEDGNSAGDWIIYDKNPNTPLTPSITAENGFIKTISNGTRNGFKLLFSPSNTTQLIGQWDWRLQGNHLQRFYFRLSTNKGTRYLRYRPETKSCSSSRSGTYIYCGAGVSVANGDVHTIIRDLQADVHAAQPDTDIISVTQVRLRGNMEVDNIILKD